MSRLPIALRALSFVVAGLVAASAVWMAGARAVESSGADRSATALDVMRIVRSWRRDMLRDHHRRRVAIVGDSMLGSDAGVPSLSDMLAEGVNAGLRSRARVGVHPLVVYGWTMIGEYCSADEIVSAEPDLLVLELNLRALQPAALGPAGFPELGGLIADSRLMEAALLPMSDAGVTLDRLLFYRLLVRNHLEERWLDLVDRQVRLLNSRDVLEHWVEATLGVETADARRLSGLDATFHRLSIPGVQRARPLHAQRMLGAVLAGMERPNARLKVFAKLLDRLRVAGIPVLVWVSPVNVDHMRSLGFPLHGLERSMVTIKKTVEDRGAEFLDLHALLSDDAFRDLGDHYTLDGEINGAERVAEPLVGAIRRAL